jgi:hypothetical protein
MSEIATKQRGRPPGSKNKTASADALPKTTAVA